MSAPQWREGDPPIRAERAVSHNVTAMAQSARPAVFARPHVIELLAPLYPEVPHEDDNASVYFVTLRRSADGGVQIVFPELSRPGNMLAMDVVCVNQHTGGCRCDFVRLLRSVLVLSEKYVLRVTTKYVVTSMATPAPSTTPEVSGDSRGVLPSRMATLQLFVALHERVNKTSVDSLGDFELVLSHLQSGLRALKTKCDGNQLVDAVQTATRSKCHVVGCELHPMQDDDDGSEQNKPRFSLDDVFQRLTTQVEVEQMPMRDDETYVARMKRARRDVRLTDLPVAALHTFIRMLGARELAAVSGVCTVFQHLAYEVVPGLQLLLYSHQRRGLRWLLYREGSTRDELTNMPHPFVFPAVSSVRNGNLQDEDVQAESIDLIEGRLVKNATISPAADFRGGLFCDEPGLGKTITMLALILRTKGQRSDPRRLEVSRPSSATGRSLRSSGSRGRVLDTQKLASSAASLIVVPNPLIEHWKFQIASHLTDGALNVYVDDLEFKSELPSPEQLATYDVVITSFGRLTDEWKFRRPASANEERVPDRYGYEDAPQRFVDGFVNRGTSPLLMVHWVRIIVDEGHKLGGTHPTYHMRMARLFHADKRWVMTGTPTPNTLKSADLRHMHGLLVFLRDRPFGDSDGKAWMKAIAKPFEQNELAGYVRLLHLLNRIMMRHTKESVRTLIPTPIRHVVLVDPTPKEYAMYNGIAAFVRANLVTTNLDPEKPGKLHPDSLLNPYTKNRNFAMSLMRDLRIATCGGGQIQLGISGKYFAETVNMLNDQGVDPNRVAEVTQFMRKARTSDTLSLCTLCGRNLQLLMLVPCGHLACADCIESRVQKLGPSCGICNTSYKWDTFQRLQPGFSYKYVDVEWAYDNTPEPNEAAITAVSNSVAGQQRASANGSTRRPQGRSGRNDGSTIPVREREGNRQRIVPIDLARFETITASKAFYVASRIIELRKELKQAQYYDERQHENAPRPTSLRSKVVKAIIFSQFKDHIWRVKVALAQRGIHCADFIAGVSPAMRMQGLLKFRHDPNSNVLLLTDVGSHGLDLSFVTHIFLMDEIVDKSFEKQVVSRAHRMGAQQSVVVEQLLMRGSVEEVMHKMNRRDGRSLLSSTEEPEEEEPLKRHDHQDKSSVQQRQLQYLLESLRLMEEGSVAEPGLVKFEVLDNDGQFVRSASLKLPDTTRQFSVPGAHTHTASGSQPQPPRQQHQQQPRAIVAPQPSRPASTTTPPAASSTRPPPPKKPRTTVQPSGRVVASSSASAVAAATTTPVAPSLSSKSKSKAKSKLTNEMKKQKKEKERKQIQIQLLKRAVQVKIEAAVASTRKQFQQREQARRDVIDLTSDGDSADEQQSRPPPRSAQQQQLLAARYETTSSSSCEDHYDEDDSETDDEWTPVKREPGRQSGKAKASPGKAKASPGKANGKRKLTRGVTFDDDDDDEETDDEWKGGSD